MHFSPQPSYQLRQSNSQFSAKLDGLGPIHFESILSMLQVSCLTPAGLVHGPVAAVAWRGPSYPGEPRC